MGFLNIYTAGEKFLETLNFRSLGTAYQCCEEILTILIIPRFHFAISNSIIYSILKGTVPLSNTLFI